MSSTSRSLGLVIVGVLWSTAAAAAEEAPSGASEETRAGSGSGEVATDEAKPVTATPALPADSGAYGVVRRDPDGVKGISLFWESVLAGDRAYVAREYERAAARFRDATKLEPKNADGHLRLGRALFRSVGEGNATEAERRWLEALGHAHNNPTAKSKALFLLADLSERKKAYEEATKRWNAYKEHALSLKAIKTYPNTANDRLRRIEEWQKLLVEYKAVRERIERNAEEGAERERKSVK